MKIECPISISNEMVLAFSLLVPQLTSTHAPPSRADLEKLLSSPESFLLIARHPEDGPIVGAASLVVFHVLTGLRAHLEDVIVDTSSRGLGIGEALTIEALRVARQAGADGMTLTSNPHRLAANHLYLKLGFKLRETNSYIYKFE
jgi:ribosomal protein S18 acetylase RimI-like enzyme